VIALLGGGVLLYLGLRRGKKKSIEDMTPTNTYCDIRSVDPCGPDTECVPVFDEGAAPPGYENIGLCFTQEPTP
jgi:hypothetical protein